MKGLFTTFLTLFISGLLMAQTCVPDQTLADSTVGIYPSPYDSVTMTGGIEDKACVNTYYETVIQVRVPETVEISGVPVGITNITVSNVAGLPDGLTYACTPTDCSIVPDDTVGCVIIYGTVGSGVAVGDYIITLDGTVSTTIGEFPLPTIIQLLSTGAGGQSIFISVLEEGSPECATASTRELSADELDIQLFPNPTYGELNLQIDAAESADYELRLINLMGQTVYQDAMPVFSGQQQQQINLPQLPAGIYSLQLQNQQGFISRKVVINR